MSRRLSFFECRAGFKIGISRLRCLPDFRYEKIPSGQKYGLEAEDREGVTARPAMFLSSAARFPHGVHGFSSRNCL